MKSRFLGLAIIIFFLTIFVNVSLVGASTSDFIIQDFQADYYLDKDNEGRSTLKTIESITAVFPNYDQNHGIERYLPTSYDGHSVSLEIINVQNQSGLDLDYSTYRQNGNLVLRIGDADIYVHGPNTYVITYTQRDTTKFFVDTNDDEFYWDTNGTGWAQSINNLTTRVHISPNILDSLNGKQSCYYGSLYSSKQCTVVTSGDVLSVNMKSLTAGENVTIAIGFNTGTFSSYKETFMDFVTKYVMVASMTFGGIILLIICLLKLTKYKSASSANSIVPEYLPPKGLDVVRSAVILNQNRTWPAAVYVDLAVRHNIKIIEVDRELFQKTEYRLEYISSKNLTDIEQEVINTLYGDNPKLGDTHELDPNMSDIKFAIKMRSVYKKAKDATEADGYYKVNKNLKILMFSLVVIEIAQFFVSFFLLDELKTLFIPESLLMNFVISVIVLIILCKKPLTTKGRELSDYLKGLKLYIKVGEVDRLKILQSPSGAEKTPIDVNNKAKLVHLYERVLPYAILFGQEKEWSKAIGDYYAQNDMRPDWYVGNSAFNIIAFSSAMSSFSSSSASVSSISSASGGSGGGGFSGGGGGGGGGGGW